MNQKYKAFLFDLNGTMIDDMWYHVKAWRHILNELGADLTLEETKKQSYGKNRELIERVFPGRFTPEEMERMGMEKEIQYQQQFRPHLHLIKGLPELMKRAKEHQVKMAIGSAAIPFNIDYVIDNLRIRDQFETVVSADDVIHSKPDPETWIKCAERMDVKAGECIVFEDSVKGAESAANADMDVVVITTLSGADEFEGNDRIVAFVKDFTDPVLDKLFDQ